MARNKRTSSTWLPVVARYAAALHASGASTVTIEEDVARVFGARGVPTVVMATPTALWVDVDGSVRVLRVVPTSPDLSRQVAVHRVGSRIAAGVSPDAALAAVDALDREAPPWSPAADLAAFGLSGAAMAALLGGGAADVLVAVVASWVAMRVEAALRERSGLAPFAAFAAALASGVLARLSPSADPGLASFAAIVAFAPGLMMTLAITEITAGHWSGGTARLVGAASVLLQLAAGLAGASALPVAPWGPDVALPGAAWWLAVGASPVALGVLFRLRPSDLGPSLVIAAVVAAISARWPEVGGTFVAAATASAAARWLGQRRGLPTLVLAVPAVTLLVPGSVGIRGVGQLLGDVDGGGDVVLGALGAAAAIAAGLLIGQAGLAPPRPARAPWPETALGDG